jgi:hypothetical protein
LYARIDALEDWETGRGAREEMVRERTVRERCMMAVGEGRISHDVLGAYGVSLTRFGRWPSVKMDCLGSSVPR